MSGGQVKAERELRQPGKTEFVAGMALMISLVALSIDAMLPALPAIGVELGVAEANDAQLVVSMLFLGLAASMMIFGPLSDSFGRKPVIYAGFAVFIAGCLMSIFASSFTMMLIGRLLQGIGAAGPRTVSIALVRDRFEGRAMASMMSMIMGVFILVPVFAPAIGQVIVVIAHWRIIFVVLLVLATVSFLWFWLRQPETLPAAKRRPFSVLRVALAIRETCTNRFAAGYTLTAGLIFGAFIGYLISAQQIFQVQYAVGEDFPIYFAVIALSLGAASFSNARLVMHFGMRRLTRWSLISVSAVSVAFLGVALATAGDPPLWALMAYLVVAFFFIGFIFGNFNALAMEPLGHIAGAASSVVGSMTLFISLLLGTVIGQAYDGTVLPMAVGFAVLGVASTVVVGLIERGRTQQDIGDD
jgi:DHA1 family bicyclomycin/chloramphenicol resistance-like MFS transporter